MKIFKLTLGFLLLTTLAYADFTPPTENYESDEFDVLLIHGDQADGTAGTDILDSETTPKTITAVGNAQVDTAQYKNLTGSTGSILFDGTGDYLTLADSADWAFGSGNFTVDFWVRFSALPSGSYPATRAVIFTQPDDTWYLSLVNSSGTTYQWWFYANGFNGGGVMDRTTTVAINTWYHIAFVRNGSVFTIFQDGVQVGTTLTSSDAIPDFAGNLEIGGSSSYSTNLTGWIDEFRISKGVARDWITASGKQFIWISE